jgi:O-antigen/teichoic acid export membrane protein
MATVTSLVVAPVNMAMFPRFSQLVSLKEHGALSHLYHLACQLISVGIMPIVAVTVLFAPEILMAWTGDPAIVEGASLLLALLIIANGMNGLVNMPYTLQLSFGWTTLAFYANIVGLLVLVPVLVILAGPLGGIAGALFWMTVNVGYILVNVSIMHTRILVGEAAHWYLQDLGLPLIGAFVAAGSVRLLYHGGTRVADLSVVLLAGLLAVTAAMLMAPLIRRAVVMQILLRVRRTQTAS